ncbi:XRE family transcriptional regulator [Arenibacter sp. N53]|uniref:helix-turn-helix domain-containing protein n=1 Tax=Arenibacter TaxID=178469 RepID=UPI000CD411F5|nr:MULTISPECIES: helix-turn-helix transcriptional regulator [Arenibacter]MCM4152522.1 XRE family transcriptional regulator [Arenibacter sp. N53]
MSASVFADTIGVQRSGISHLLAGRNKPSLEFVLKVVSSFPEVDLYWLIYGEGVFPKKAKTTPSSNPAVGRVIKRESSDDPNSKHRTIDKIVIFYSDGSFKAYSEN